MEILAGALSPMGDASWERWQHAKAMLRPLDDSYAPEEDAARLDIFLGGLAFEAQSDEAKAVYA